MAVEIIIDDDAEAVVINYLVVALAGVDGYADIATGSKVPNPRPDRYFQVMRTGGVRRDLVTDRPQILVIAASNDEADAAAMLNVARAHITAAERIGFMGSTTCSYVNEYSGPAQYPDPNSGQYRYRSSFELDLRAEGA